MAFRPNPDPEVRAAIRARMDARRLADQAVTARVLADLRAAREATASLAAARRAAALVDAAVAIADTYGPAAAETAAQMYEGVRADSGVRGAFRPSVASVSADAVSGSGRYYAYRADVTDQSFDAMGPSLVRHVMQAGRETIAGSVRRDPAKPRFARVPSGASTCAFCLVLASRGAIYLSRDTAGGAHEYHDDCDCQPTPVYSALPGGYEPDVLYEQYRDARAVSESMALKGQTGILATLRRQQGIA